MTTPEQAILDDLARPLGTWTPSGEPSEGGWQAGTLVGGRGDVVDLLTLRVVKTRCSPTRRAVFVTYRAVNPRHGSTPHDVHALYELWPVDGGWAARDVMSGGGGEPAWTRPTVNLGGGGWPDRFSAGGTVHGGGHAIVRVQLRFDNAVVLEDDTIDAAVVFVTDEHVEPPTTAVLYDESGREVRAHEVLPGV
jgi:hypothetical protein